MKNLRFPKETILIIDHQIEYLTHLATNEPKYKDAFDKFLNGLRTHASPSVSKSDAIEMLAQHIITKPAFDALFEGHLFIEKNPISIAIQEIMDVLQKDDVISVDPDKMERFYDSVRQRIEKIKNV